MRSADSLEARLAESQYIRRQAAKALKRAARALHQADTIVRQRRRELRRRETEATE